MLTALIVAAVLVAASSRDNPLETAQEACDSSHTGTELADGGNTLIVDGDGDEDPTGIGIVGLACLLSELKAPASVTQEMSSTRALDGRQQGSWEGFEASWSYHPDSGLDMVITRQ